MTRFDQSITTGSEKGYGLFSSKIDITASNTDDKDKADRWKYIFKNSKKKNFLKYRIFTLFQGLSRLKKKHAVLSVS